MANQPIPQATWIVRATANVNCQHPTQSYEITRISAPTEAAARAGAGKIPAVAVAGERGGYTVTQAPPGTPEPTARCARVLGTDGDTARFDPDRDAAGLTRWVSMDGRRAYFDHEVEETSATAEDVLLHLSSAPLAPTSALAEVLTTLLDRDADRDDIEFVVVEIEGREKATAKYVVEKMMTATKRPEAPTFHDYARALAQALRISAHELADDYRAHVDAWLSHIEWAGDEQAGGGPVRVCEQIREQLAACGRAPLAAALLWEHRLRILGEIDGRLASRSEIDAATAAVARFLARD